MALFRNDSDESLDLPALDLHVPAHASFVVEEDWAIAGLLAQPLVTLESDPDGTPNTGPADEAPESEPAADPAPAAAAPAATDAAPAAAAAAPTGPVEVDAPDDSSVHDFTA